jgi:hypothetical protein
MIVNLTWQRVAYGRTRDDAMAAYLAWRDEAGISPTAEQLRLNWGRHADGGDYWEILHLREDDACPSGGPRAEDG